MKVSYLVVLTLSLSITGCNTLKKDLIQTGGQEEVIKNAIYIFSKSNRLYKKDTVFSVLFLDEIHKMILVQERERDYSWVRGGSYSGIAGVSISADYNKILLPDSTKVGDIGVKIPTRYIEQAGKLFYWWDDSYPLTEETLSVFRKYNLLVQNDMKGVIEFFNFSINDAQKGVDYYFCKNNLTVYKEVITNIAIEYYDPPKLRCIDK